MNVHQRQTTNGKDGHHDDALAISKLSLHGNGAAAPSSSGTPVSQGVNVNGGENGGAAVSDKPNLNILNQASNLTQLSATQTSFDPTLQVMVASTNGATGTGGSPAVVSLEPQQQQPPQQMIPSFLIQPSPSNTSQQHTAVMMHQNHHIAAQITASQSGDMGLNVLQPPAVAHVTHHVQQPLVQSVADAARLADVSFHQQNAAVVKQVVQASMSMGGAPPATAAAPLRVSPPTTHVVQQQQPTMHHSYQQIQIQQSIHHSQQHAMQMQQQPIYTENKDYIYSDKKTLMNGRVPATRRDGRKLFVGGLPNEGKIGHRAMYILVLKKPAWALTELEHIFEHTFPPRFQTHSLVFLCQSTCTVTDLSFLQYFQQYGEVIDSVVLLDRRTKRSRGFGFVTFADPVSDL